MSHWSSGVSKEGRVEMGLRTTETNSKKQRNMFSPEVESMIVASSVIA